MQFAHSLINVLIWILLGRVILIMRMIYIYFIVGASAPWITFNIGTIIPMHMLITSNSKTLVGYLSLLFESV